MKFYLNSVKQKYYELERLGTSNLARYVKKEVIKSKFFLQSQVFVGVGKLPTTTTKIGLPWNNRVQKVTQI